MDSRLPAGHQGSGTPDAAPGDRGGSAKRFGRRRFVLTAAASGVGAGIGVARVTGAAPAGAAGPPAVLLGVANTASATTSVTASAGTGLQGTASQDGASGLAGIDESPGGGHGIYGRSANGVGAYGSTGQDGQSGVYGVDNSPDGGYGVRGSSGWGYGTYGVSEHGTGAYGRTSASAGLQVGVEGVDQGSVAGFGVQGTSALGWGVHGLTMGTAGSGVLGSDNSPGGATGVTGLSANGDGLRGETVTNGKSGVVGTDMSSGGGHGTFGKSTSGVGAYGGSSSGVGVYADSSSGVALQVDGVATFSRSGLATLAATPASPLSSVMVTGVDLSSSSMVLATLQAHVVGVGVAGVVADASTSSFTVYLTKPVRKAVPVAWFVIG